MTLLAIENLSVHFKTRAGTVRAIEHASLEIAKGETVGLVGESGSGKSVLSLAVMRILDPAARIVSGAIRFGGLDLLGATEPTLQEIRGREIAMIFQNPRTSLNPIRKIGQQIEDVLRQHTTTVSSDLKRKAIECLAAVHIPDPGRRYEAYPFELSGGQCQRVMIALALACNPQLLIADEPTTGLDVTTQAAILALIRDLARSRGLATLFITHDLALASESCDRIVVMHAGHIVESAPAATLFSRPRHPYTAQLIAATPAAGMALENLAAIPGGLPDLHRDDLPACRFLERCTRSIDRCRSARAEIAPEPGHRVVCCNPL